MREACQNKPGVEVNGTTAQNIYAETMGGNAVIAHSSAAKVLSALAVSEADGASRDKSPAEREPGLRFVSGQTPTRIEITDSEAGEITARGVVVTPYVALKEVKSESSQEAAGQEMIFGLKPVLSQYVERKPIMEKIIAGLMSSNSVVLTGMRGSGKSFLARLYANQYKKNYSSIYCLSANNRSKCEEEFGILLKNNPRSPLVILDGAFNDEEINGYLEKMPASAKVIITSAYKVWPSIYSIVEVPVYTREESSCFFENNNINVDASVVSLMDEYGDHPLALAQACAFISKNKITPQRYMQLYQQQPALILRGGNLKSLPLDYSEEPVFSLWDRELQMCGNDHYAQLEKYSIEIFPGSLVQKVLALKAVAKIERCFAK